MVELALEGTGITLRRARRRARTGIELPAATAALPQVRDRRAAPRRPAGLQHTHRALRDRLRVAPQPRPRAAARLHRADRGPARLARAGPPLPARPQHRARTKADFRSQHHNIPSLVAMQPWPLVHLHPADAAARGIADGDEVDVVTPRGRVRFKAHVTEDIVRGAVEANMGGGGPLGPEAWQRANVNELTDALERRPDLGLPGGQGAALRGRAGGRRLDLRQAPARRLPRDDRPPVHDPVRVEGVLQRLEDVVRGAVLVPAPTGRAPCRCRGGGRSSRRGAGSPRR